MQEVSTTEISMTHLRDWLGWYNGCLAINTDCRKQTLARVRCTPNQLFVITTSVLLSLSVLARPPPRQHAFRLGTC